LVVLIGAGASFDCTSADVQKDADLTPPLVKDLFAQRGTFARILNAYPLAAMAAAEIRSTLPNEAIALEAYLSERLRASTDDYARRRYRQIPLYLQELFHRISAPASPDELSPVGFTRQPDNYDVLLNATLSLDRVVYITLNYDTLLDQRLGSYSTGFRTLADYIPANRNWTLAKLHGSINWARPLTRELAADRGQMPREAYVEHVNGLDELELDRHVVMRGGDLETMRFNGGRIVYYPALSAPLGAADELSCPPEHVAHLKRVLGEMGEINLLVIGYSGLDQEVLQLLAESTTGLSQLLVANGTSEASVAAADKIATALGHEGAFPADAPYRGGFGDLVSSGALRTFVQSLA
jgi:hypothetical protein